MDYPSDTSVFSMLFSDSVFHSAMFSTRGESPFPLFQNTNKIISKKISDSHVPKFSADRLLLSNSLFITILQKVRYS